MPRRGFIAKRDVLPDPIYNSKVVTKLINNIMLDGKKSVAQGIVYDAFDIIKEKEGRGIQYVENSIYITGIKRRPWDRGGRSDLDPGRTDRTCDYLQITAYQSGADNL